MKELSALMGVKHDIRVLDATMRDGGLVNNFGFSDEFVKALYETNIKAGVDYMEFGYRADKEIFPVDQFGKWKYASDDDIRAIVGENNTDLKISIMADVDRTDYINDIRPKNESPVDLIRVATYVHQIPGAVQMIEDAKKKGYEVSCNIMAVSKAQEDDIRYSLDALCNTGVDIIYIVDSYGALYHEQIARIAHLYGEYGAKYGKQIGMHAHDNQRLAFANTIESVGDGVNFLDATYDGMGRGAGNCQMELLLGFLKNPKYKEYYAIKFVENYMNPLRASGVKWGYDMQYLVTGLLNEHPRTAIAFTNEGRSDYTNFYREMAITD